MEAYFPVIIKQNKKEKPSQVKATDAKLRVSRSCDTDAQDPAFASSIQFYRIKDPLIHNFQIGYKCPGFAFGPYE
jgi:hypothetical protein